MKNLSTFAMSRIGLVSLFSLCVIILSISFISISDEPGHFRSINSSISLTNFLNASGSKSVSKISCEANFSFEDGELMDISAFQFDIPTDQFNGNQQQMASAVENLFRANHVDNIRFVQEKVMVLPRMKMIHLIGTIKIGSVNQPIAFQFAYTINRDQSLSITGKQAINLNDFGIKIPTELKDVIKNEININLDLKMINEELIF